ncbi:MAG TPA: NCS2 family permease [Bacteroidales bacterium]|nr:NCS2 family permease [Bacteroidales bacterium]
MLEKYFRLKENDTNLRTEIIAGLTTFMTMAYILALNPSILGDTGMDRNALFTATALSACIATLVMAFWAKLPFALAPGLGLNAFFAYTVVLKMGYSWQMALTAVFVEGIIFILLTSFNIREAIIDSIPLNLKHAISAGIGLFIAFLGLKNAGIIAADEKALLSLGNMADHGVWIAFIGILVTGVLLILRIRGALLIGIFVSALAGIPLGVTKYPQGGLFSLPPSLTPGFFQFDFSKLFTIDMLVVLFTFLFVDLFDTVGTLIGVSGKAGMLDEHGNLPRAKQALFADAIGTVAGAILGTSTVTTYVESASGVAEGGKTGMTAFSVAIFFALALFCAPLFLMVPSAATAPALIIVGLYMLSPLQKVNLDNMEEAIPVFLTIIIMPLTLSISEGIIFGMLSYVLLKVFTGKFREVSIVMYILSLFFILKFFI